jgi:hypothetical protein
MVIFHSYVKLPEGKILSSQAGAQFCPEMARDEESEIPLVDDFFGFGLHNFQWGLPSGKR